MTERKQQQFFRDTWAEIDLDALFSNMKSIIEYLPAGTKVFSAMKANAYGHGAVQSAKTVLRAGAHGLLVAMLDEALVLRKAGIMAPILVLGATRPEYAETAARHDISLTVFQTDWVREAEKVLKGESLKVHIKCDTGMGRIGLRTIGELQELENCIRNSRSIRVEGIYTHFATADQLDAEFYEKQLSRFHKLAASLKERPAYVHAANSAGALYHKDSIFNAVRIGIAQYGLSPSEEIKPFLKVPLRPVLSLHTRIVHMKKNAPGESVSYGAKYVSAAEEWIATVPVGYADGWIRKLQGFQVLAAGKKAPIVGRICMDQCMISLPNPLPIDTKVTLIGSQDAETVSADDAAAWIGTINYEVTCMISSRVPRIYLKDGKAVALVNLLLGEH